MIRGEAGLARLQQSFQITRDDAWTDRIFRQERFVRSPNFFTVRPLTSERSWASAQQGPDYCRIVQCQAIGRDIAIDNRAGGDFGPGADANQGIDYGVRTEKHPLLEDSAAIGGGVRRKHNERMGNRIVSQRGIRSEQDVIADPDIAANRAKGTDDAAIAYRRICCDISGGMYDRDEARATGLQFSDQFRSRYALADRHHKAVLWLNGVIQD